MIDAYSQSPSRANPITDASTRTTGVATRSGGRRQAKKATIAAVSSENAHRSVTLPSRM